MIGARIGAVCIRSRVGGLTGPPLKLPLLVLGDLGIGDRGFGFLICSVLSTSCLTFSNLNAPSMHNTL